MMGIGGTGRWCPLGLGTVQMLILRANPLVTCRTLCSWPRPPLGVSVLHMQETQVCFPSFLLQTRALRG